MFDGNKMPLSCIHLICTCNRGQLFTSRIGVRLKATSLNATSVFGILSGSFWTLNKAIAKKLEIWQNPQAPS